MRLQQILVFFAIALALVFFWWVRPHSTPELAQGPVEEITQASKSPKVQTEPEKPMVLVKKNFGSDLMVKGIPFQQHHKLDGPPGNDSSPMERYRGLKFSEEVRLNGRAQLVLGARAVPTPKYSPSFGPVLFEKNGFSIVGLNTQADPDWNQLVMREGDRPVVVNPSNGRLGIVTGTLMVKFSDLHQADKLAGRENLQIMSMDEAIGVAYLKAPENYQLLSAIDRLRKEPDVLRVELEVVESFKGAW